MLADRRLLKLEVVKARDCPASEVNNSALVLQRTQKYSIKKLRRRGNVDSSVCDHVETLLYMVISQHTALVGSNTSDVRSSPPHTSKQSRMVTKEGMILYRLPADSRSTLILNCRCTLIAGMAVIPPLCESLSVSELVLATSMFVSVFP